ncbi:MAG: hypothetical protein ACFE8G_11020 [Candidatus Hermodarchaeota archaeon]
MIVIFIDNIENFLSFLEKRIMDEVFYEFKEIKTETDLSMDVKIEIILHFLAKAGETLILYETRQTIPKQVNSDNDSIVISTLQKIFDQIDISLKLIKGKIREIFLSYSP